MAAPTKAQKSSAEEVLKLPDAKDLAAIRDRRKAIADILNTNLLSKEGREAYEASYAETGKILLKAAGMTAEDAAKHGL